MVRTTLAYADCLEASSHSSRAAIGMRKMRRLWSVLTRACPRSRPAKPLLVRRASRAVFAISSTSDAPLRPSMSLEDHMAYAVAPESGSQAGVL